MSKIRGVLYIGLLAARLLAAPLVAASAEDSADLRLSGTVPASPNVGVSKSRSGSVTLHLAPRQPATIAVTAESSRQGRLPFVPSRPGPGALGRTETFRVVKHTTGQPLICVLEPSEEEGRGRPSETIVIAIQAN